MNYRVGNAPCSWGVEFGDDPRNPSWQSVLDDACAAGYVGMELGPLGFLPEDPDALVEAMTSRGLTLTAAVMFRPLHDPSKFEEILDVARRTCRSLQRMGASQFVLIDSISVRRVATAGRPAEAERLSGGELQGLFDRIRTISALANDEYGMRVSMHAHAAGFIEFDDEIHRLMDAVPEELLGLCVDTGHCEYARTDPVTLYRQYYNRIPYVHYKDVDPVVRRQVVDQRIGFYDACARGAVLQPRSGCGGFQGVPAGAHRARLHRLGHGRAGLRSTGRAAGDRGCTCQL